MNLLKNAKGICDKLIVGVSTDELVRQYKKKETIIPFSERAEIVRNIRYVDAVIAQENRAARIGGVVEMEGTLFHNDVGPAGKQIAKFVGTFRDYPPSQKSMSVQVSNDSQLINAQVPSR